MAKAVNDNAQTQINKQINNIKLNDNQGANIYSDSRAFRHSFNILSLPKFVSLKRSG